MGLAACKQHPQRRRGIRAGEVSACLARPGEYGLRDELMARHHELGFKRFAGRGLRHVVERDGRRLRLSGWQTGALKPESHDVRVGWMPEQQRRRLYPVANSTRFAMLGETGGRPNLASHALKRICARLSADRERAFGHPPVLAETFADGSRHRGRMQLAGGRLEVGESAGRSRKGGKCSARHGCKKRAPAEALRRDARRILRRGQGRKHSIGCVMATIVAAKAAGCEGCLAVAQFSAARREKERAALGGRRNPKTGRREPVSKPTVRRVLQSADPAELGSAFARYCRKRRGRGRALAGDGKRINGANRNSEAGDYYEIIALVSHATGAGRGDEPPPCGNCPAARISAGF